MEEIFSFLVQRCIMAKLWNKLHLDHTLSVNREVYDSFIDVHLVTFIESCLDFLLCDNKRKSML